MGTGLITTLPLSASMVLPRIHEKRFSRVGILQPPGHPTGLSREQIAFSTSAPAGPRCAPAPLSGGNLQKALLARELAWDPLVLLAAQPTRGLDIAAAQFVHQQFLQLRERDRGLLVISEDLEELFALSDRIAVMFEGRIMDVLPIARGHGSQGRHAHGRRQGGGMIGLRLELREHTPVWLNLALPLLAVLATLVLCSGLIALAGANRVHGLRQAVSKRRQHPLQPGGDGRQGHPPGLYRPGRDGRLSGQVLEHRRRRAAAGRRHGRGFYRRPGRALPAWCLVPAMIAGGAAAGALWAADPGGFKDPLQGGRRRHHPAAELHHLLRDDGPVGRPLERSL